MIFSTYEFIFLFLPLAYAGYFALSTLSTRTAAKVAIVAASFVFYWYGTGSFSLVFAALVLTNFVLGTKLSSMAAGPRHRARLLLAFGVFLDLAVLGYYKYYDFVVSNLNGLTGASLELKHIVLPIGISFFTFQLIAYLVDSYKGDTAGYGIVDYLVFISFFPQLVVGPIVHHKEVVPQFEDSTRASVDYGNMSVGLFLLAIGLAKKVLFADPLTDWAKQGGFETGGFARADQAWLQAVSYSVAYYYDLSGYGDMAIGLGKLFNIELPWNFNSPFKARNFADFWRRWHITLSRFLGDYVFRSVYKKGAGSGNFYLALFVTFFVSGFWHGAGWNFVVWGVINGLFVMAAHAMTRANRAMPFVLAWSLTFLGVVLLRVMFVSPTLTFCLETYRVMADWNSINLAQLVRHGQQAKWLAIALGVALFAPNTKSLMERFKPNRAWGAAVLVTLLVCVVSMNKVSDFLYFQF